MSSKLFLRIEDPPLDCADWRCTGSGDFVILPLLDKAQCHYVALSRIQKRHPVPELKARSVGRMVVASFQAIPHFRQINRFHLPRQFAIVSSKCVLGDSKQPDAEQSAVADLARFSINGKHHFLRQVFRYPKFATPHQEESDELWGEHFKERRERTIARIVQKLISYYAFLPLFFVASCLVGH